jgi:GNAT superfamily N-acetyltransferase
MTVAVEGALIRPCDDADVPAICAIVNDAAEAHGGVIPADRWHEPYMPENELRGEIRRRRPVLGAVAGGRLVGVMGLQDVQDVALIRHAYAGHGARRYGVGGALQHLLAQTARPMLVGTWAAATWAIRFYEKHGFTLTAPNEKARLLRRYWSIPDRQIETSVVLADARWRSRGAS